MKHHISYVYNALFYYPLHQAWCET